MCTTLFTAWFVHRFSALVRILCVDGHYLSCWMTVMWMVTQLSLEPTSSMRIPLIDMMIVYEALAVTTFRTFGRAAHQWCPFIRNVMSWTVAFPFSIAVHWIKEKNCHSDHNNTSVWGTYFICLLNYSKKTPVFYNVIQSSWKCAALFLKYSSLHFKYSLLLLKY